MVKVDPSISSLRTLPPSPWRSFPSFPLIPREAFSELLFYHDVSIRFQLPLPHRYDVPAVGYLAAGNGRVQVWEI